MKLVHHGCFVCRNHTHDVRVIEIREEDKSLQAGTDLDGQLSIEGVEDDPVLLRVRVVLWTTQWSQQWVRWWSYQIVLSQEAVIFYIRAHVDRHE